MEAWTTGAGQKLSVHDRKKSCDRGCVIHHPSDHPLKDAPTYWRTDRNIMERTCSHGVGHPDPDDMAFIRRTRGEDAFIAESVHGCDGCCKSKAK